MRRSPKHAQKRPRLLAPPPNVDSVGRGGPGSVPGISRSRINPRHGGPSLRVAPMPFAQQYRGVAPRASGHFYEAASPERAGALPEVPRCRAVRAGCAQDDLRGPRGQLAGVPRARSGVQYTGPAGRAKRGLRDRNSPTCTLSQNGYGADLMKIATRPFF